MYCIEEKNEQKWVFIAKNTFYLFHWESFSYEQT